MEGAPRASSDLPAGMKLAAVSHRRGVDDAVSVIFHSPEGTSASCRARIPTPCPAGMALEADGWCERLECDSGFTLRVEGQERFCFRCPAGKLDMRESRALGDGLSLVCSTR
jgi:hypothetical protein